MSGTGQPRKIRLMARHAWVAWLLVIHIRTTTGEYHTQSGKQLTLPNMTMDSYFGYSLTYQAVTRRLIVGAPKATIVGQVFSIKIDSYDIVPIDLPQIIKTNANNFTSNVVSHKHFLLGATVKAGSNFFVACAPKNAQFFTINFKDKTQITKLTVMGLCFKHLMDGDINLLDNDKPETGNNGSKVFKPYGWGLDITKTNAVIVGATAMSYGLVKVIQDKRYEFKQPPGVSYSFGYSVTSGNYFGDTRSNLYYAISTPYGKDGIGKVLFYDAKYLKLKSSIEDRTWGSLFGASLCTVHLVDHRDYLLIGAPMYTQDNIIDRGAVYLYTSNGMKFNLHKTIEEPSVGAYFGNSLANLGDMDGDKKDEVAIGAPYEDLGRGAVYIYSGAHLLDPNQSGKEMLLQRIQPEPNSGIRSFGFSLTAIQDYDDNGCNELAVGAPDSNSVVIYKCFTYITINLEAIFPTKTQLQENQQNEFTFQSCIIVQFPEKPKHIEDNILVIVKVFHKDVWFRDQKNAMSYDVTINRKETKYCKNVTVLTRKTDHFEELMSYTITASLKNDSRYISDFDSARVLLSAQSILSLDGEESLVDCEGRICNPVLLIHFKSNTVKPYIVGSTPEESFSFFIDNNGDTAYTACLRVHIQGAPLLGLPQGCSNDAENFICKPNILLRNGTVWDTGFFTLDTRGLTSKDEVITISSKLFIRCNNPNNYIPGDEPIYLNSSTAGINITNESVPGDVVDILSKPSRVRQVYTITNSGPTSWDGVNIDIILQNEINVINYENIIAEIEDYKQVFCQISKDETEGVLKAKCNYIYLKTGNTVKVIIPFVVSPIDSNHAVETRSVSTILKMHLKTTLIESSIVTQLQFKKSTVPIWVIVMASLIGLLLVGIFLNALYSFGYLKRDKKSQLVRLKDKVHRQSVYRQSMRQTQRFSGEVEKLLTEQTSNTLPNQEKTD